MLAFAAQGGAGAVAGVNGYIVAQGQQGVHYAVHQGIHIAAGQVGAAYGVLKQHIAAKTLAVGFVEKHHVARRMAGCEQHLESRFAKLYIHRCRVATGSGAGGRGRRECRIRCQTTGQPPAPRVPAPSIRAAGHTCGVPTHCRTRDRDGNAYSAAAPGAGCFR